MSITCNYCRAANADEDYRCQRCGRRLHGAPPSRTISAAYSVSNTATARSIHPSAHLQTPPAPERQAQTATPPDAPRRAIYQRTLFSSRDVPQVVPIESFTPKASAHARTRTAESPRTRTRRADPDQQTLEFTAPAAEPDTEAQTVIGCDAPVALPAHRIMAAAADFSLMAVAMAMFLGVFRLCGGEVMLTKQTAPLFAVVALVFALLYKALWCFGNGDTAGMRWAHLRLVDFDGERPGRRQRFYRVFSGLLSLGAAGLGVMWALVDEESLTWHDHISKTFPTPY